ncbi:hypothetical protein WICMUC_000610 [Wickerhamomyces mucosus]|uniref:Transcription factor MBP1 n=1 Tax=Wickerhamomyces mucosus TaxID=1378264 RepID=A0A9P8PX99_9ASCO|nr:hypothetical protein WICMUC_000610 [Wickerhamomyces mucosus]
MDRVFSATYSGVNVYEFIDVTGSVMRRKVDGWVNATHILKAADFPKAKRTRILERDVQIGEHEKVQGGYGKYQGTWVPLDRAKSIAKEFGVLEKLSPLFDFVSTNGMNSPPPAPKHHHASKNTSTLEKLPKVAKAKKTQSMPLPKKQRLNEFNSDLAHIVKKRGRPKRSESVITNIPLNKSISQTKKPHVPKTLTNQHSKVPEINKYMDSTVLDDDQSDEEGGLDDDLNIELIDNDGNDTAAINLHDGISSDVDHSYDQLESTQHLIATSSPSDFLSDTDLANALKSPNQRHKYSNLSQVIYETPKVPFRRSYDTFGYDANSEYIERLLDYFMNGDDDTESKLPDFLVNPPKSLNIDQVIDEEGHSVFHWTCAMGSALAADALIKLGANYRIVNALGETPLMKSVQFTNSFTKKSFPRLVELLSESLFEFDSTHKTILHHIANSANPKSRIPSSYYYMDILLAKIYESQAPERLENYLNLQDNLGNTALHICAKNANRKCIKLLLQYKAKTSIKNNDGLIASEILLENGNVTPKIHLRYEQHLRNQNRRKNELFKRDSIIVPHVSEAAIEATQRVSKILIDSLNELSTAYDLELARKEADVKEIEELLQSMNEDIRQTKFKANRYIGEVLSDDQISHRVKLLEDQIKRLEMINKTKEKKLFALIERSQAKKLSQNFKTQIKLSQESHGDSPEERLSCSIELSKLQIQRKELVSEIINLYAGSSTERMQKYKRLISACSEVEINQVDDKIDDLLEEIQKNMR